ncbi:hypothetical protein, partial [Aeromonas dhakensis]|uniref:hypothetical protein n=1 Tax=Aeromonas dhakensis TaxID=196024 RepID=UPI001BDE8C3A
MSPLMLRQDVEEINKSATYRVIQKRLSLPPMASFLPCKMGKIPALSQNHRNLIASLFLVKPQARPRVSHHYPKMGNNFYVRKRIRNLDV